MSRFDDPAAVRADLCRLLADIRRAVERVEENASAARLDVERLCRNEAGGGDSPRFDALVADIENALAVKTTALESEAVVADAVLERLDTAISELPSRAAVDAVLESAARLPALPVEPSHIAVVETPTGPAVAAPRGVSAAVVAIQVPRYATPGRSAELRLSLLDTYASRLPDEVVVAAASLAAHLHIEAFLLSSTSHSPIEVAVSPGERGSVIASVPVPGDATADAQIIIRSVTVAGEPLPAASLTLPACVVVSLGIHSPLVLKGAASGCSAAPAISTTGTLYAPDSNNSNLVPVFAADGTPLAPLKPEALGLREPVRSAAIARTGPGSAEMLLLSDSHTLLALDPESRAVQWLVRANPDDDIDMGIAVLQRAGVAVVTSYSNDLLHVHRLSDGLRIASSTKGALTSKPSHITVDPTTEAVYAYARGIHKFCWTGAALEHRGRVDRDAALIAGFAPLAVMPSRSFGAGGDGPSYLLAAPYNAPVLHIYSLPDCTHVTAHKFAHLRIESLTADPSGCALAVGDGESHAIHVLPWPLPDCPL